MAVSLRRGSLKQRGWFFPGHRLDWIRITDSTPKMQTILTTHPQHRKAMCPMMSEVTLAPRFTVYSHYDWLGMVFQKARMPAVSFTVTRGGPNSLKCPSTLLWARTGLQELSWASHHVVHDEASAHTCETDTDSRTFFGSDQLV